MCADVEWVCGETPCRHYMHSECVASVRRMATKDQAKAIFT